MSSSRSKVAPPRCHTPTTRCSCSVAAVRTPWPGDRFVAADLTEADEVRRAIEQIKPDFVIHTAGRTQPASRRRALPREFLGDDSPVGRPSFNAKTSADRPVGLGSRARSSRSRSLAGGRVARWLPARCLRPKQMAGDFGGSCRAIASGGHCPRASLTRSDREHQRARRSADSPTG